MSRQQSQELSMMNKEQRQKIIMEAGIRVEVGADDGVAMKSDLGIPWNKMRHIRRFVHKKMAKRR